jgi:hypothetical protein
LLNFERVVDITKPLAMEVVSNDLVECEPSGTRFRLEDCRWSVLAGEVLSTVSIDEQAEWLGLCPRDGSS